MPALTLSKRTLVVLLVGGSILPCIGLLTAHRSVATSVQAPRSALAHVPETSVRLDTMQYLIQAGDLLIVNLPERNGQRAVDRYTLRRPPSLSWLVDQSFFWRTLDSDRGRHRLWFHAALEGGGADSLLVEVEIR